MKKTLSRYFSEILAALLLSAAVSPLLLSFEKINYNSDFLQLATRHVLLRKAVLQDRALPLWTPYLNGGFPSVADPEDPALSPFSLLTVAFGAVQGLKLVVLLLFFVGCVSMCRFLREVLGTSAEGASLGAVIFGLSGWFITRIYSGNVNELYYFLVPLILICLERFWRSGGLNWGFYASALTAVIAMDGKTSFIAIVLFLAVYSFFRSRCVRAPRYFESGIFLRFLAVICAALFFSLVKIIPVLELFSYKGSLVNPVIDTHSGVYGEVVAFKLGDLLRGFVLPDLPNRAVSVYSGFIPLLLAGYALLFRLRDTRIWLALGIMFAALWAGPNSPVDIFHSLWRLPFFGAISQPHKYFDFFVVFCVCAAATLGFDAVVSRMRGRPRLFAVLGGGLAAAAICPLFFFSFPKYSALFNSEVPDIRPGTFFQVKLLSDWQNGGHMFFNSLQNVGTINWYGAILLSSSVQPRYFVSPGSGARANPEYKGESFCLGAHSACEPVYFGANTLAAAVTVPEDDRLVFNQNYDAYWKSSHGDVENYGGLISVKLKGSPGRQLVILDYAPTGFYVGAGLSLLSVLAAAWWAFWRPRWKKSQFPV